VSASKKALDEQAKFRVLTPEEGYTSEECAHYLNSEKENAKARVDQTLNK